MSVCERLGEISEIGRDVSRGGYSRHLFDDHDLQLRQWFCAAARDLGLTVEIDGNANIWAWWGERGSGAVVTGSHLDSVPGGGAYDGPLGVVCALEAVAILAKEGWRPNRPLAVCVFSEEEGSRFGLPCLGTRLMTGEVAAEDILALTDRDGIKLCEAWTTAGFSTSEIGADPDRVAEISAFVELHVEQGYDLEERGVPLSSASAIMAHGRWRLTISGEGNHAGTTPMSGRRDPVVAAAAASLVVRDVALAHPSARGTVGRIGVTPNGTNVIASRVDAWLDIRAHSDADVREQLATSVEMVRKSVEAEGCTLTVVEESFSPLVSFDTELTDLVSRALGDAPSIPTGAGHDAGILAGHMPAAMIFVRNPTGVSHAPTESARDEDCEAGARGLAEVLRQLANRQI